MERAVSCAVEGETRTPGLWRRVALPPTSDFPRVFSRMMRPGQSASLHASRGDRVSHGGRFLRPSWLFSTAEARTINSPSSSRRDLPHHHAPQHQRCLTERVGVRVGVFRRSRWSPKRMQLDHAKTVVSAAGCRKNTVDVRSQDCELTRCLRARMGMSESFVISSSMSPVS